MREMKRFIIPFLLLVALTCNLAAQQTRFVNTIQDFRPEVAIIDMLEPHSIRKIAMELHPDVTGQAAIDAMEARLSALGFERRWISNQGHHIYFEMLASA